MFYFKLPDLFRFVPFFFNETSKLWPEMQTSIHGRGGYCSLVKRLGRRWYRSFSKSAGLLLWFFLTKAGTVVPAFLVLSKVENFGQLGGVFFSFK
jgi:hypothetical protein